MSKSSTEVSTITRSISFESPPASTNGRPIEKNAPPLEIKGGPGQNTSKVVEGRRSLVPLFVTQGRCGNVLSEPDAHREATLVSTPLSPVGVALTATEVVWATATAVFKLAK